MGCEIIHLGLMQPQGPFQTGCEKSWGQRDWKMLC